MAGMGALKPYQRGLVLIVSLVALGYVVRTTGLFGLLDEAWIDAEIRGRGLSGELLFIAAGAVVTACGFPRQAVGFLGGYAFGLGLGTALALVACLGGCVLAFGYARLLGRSLVLALFPERIRRLDEFLHDNPLSMALLLRLLPVGSNLVTNLAAGVSGVRAVPFFAGSVIGYVPQTLIFALLGSGIRLDPALRIGASVVLFIASGMLGLYLFRRYRRSRALDAEMASALAEDPGSSNAGRGS
jgi:uncharacterized membrane protein YdjX (TVP38/TMEM64 family)